MMKLVLWLRKNNLHWLAMDSQVTSSNQTAHNSILVFTTVKVRRVQLCGEGKKILFRSISCCFVKTPSDRIIIGRDSIVVIWFCTLFPADKHQIDQTVMTQQFEKEADPRMRGTSIFFLFFLSFLFFAHAWTAKQRHSQCSSQDN